MKRTRIILLIGLAIVAAGICVYGIYFVANKVLGQNEGVSCQTAPAEHFATIKNGRLAGATIRGGLCDTLTITNDDDQMRLMAFGVHDHHQSYDGITEKTLLKGQSLTIVMDQRGTFTFHDHLHDEVEGTFTVQ